MLYVWPEKRVVIMITMYVCNYIKNISITLVLEILFIYSTYE